MRQGKLDSENSNSVALHEFSLVQVNSCGSRWLFCFLKKPCIYIIATYLLFQTLGHDLRGAPGHAGFKQGEKQ